MENNNYRPRLIDQTIEEYLQTFGALCIEGPKWCGKTWTSRFHAKSEISIGDPAGNFQNRKLAMMAPDSVLDGISPRMIDEWQEVPPLWDAVRFRVDSNTAKGQFILTGSSTPKKKGVLHSGAGRIAHLKMYPMSLYESGASSGTVSLQDLYNKKIQTKLTGEVQLIDIAELIVRGGWPANIDLPLKKAALLPKEYLKAVINDDVNKLDDIKRDTHKMELLLRSLARNESTTASNKTLKNDIREKDSSDLDDNTISSYLDIFKRLFITDNIEPFGTKIRSSMRVKQAEKRHFCDPSLVCALLNITPQKLITDLQTMGLLFESLVERDLRIYAESLGAKLYHYQDYSNKEIDAVIEFPDGAWIGIEIKLGAHEIDTAAKNLLSIKYDENPPTALAVICGLSNAAYQRPDGIFVLPITALRA